jgi:hypothetical protein
MKAWHGKGDVRVDAVPAPAIKDPTDVIIEVTSTGRRSSFAVRQGIEQDRRESLGQSGGELGAHLVDQVSPRAVRRGRPRRPREDTNGSGDEPCGWSLRSSVPAGS